MKVLGGKTCLDQIFIDIILVYSKKFSQIASFFSGGTPHSQENITTFVLLPSVISCFFSLKYVPKIYTLNFEIVAGTQPSIRFFPFQ